MKMSGDFIRRRRRAPPARGQVPIGVVSSSRREAPSSSSNSSTPRARRQLRNSAQFLRNSLTASPSSPGTLNRKSWCPSSRTRCSRYATDAIFPAAVHGYYGRKAAREGGGGGRGRRYAARPSRASERRSTCAASATPRPRSSSRRPRASMKLDLAEVDEALQYAKLARVSPTVLKEAQARRDRVKEARERDGTALEMASAPAAAGLDAEVGGGDRGGKDRWPPAPSRRRRRSRGGVGRAAALAAMQAAAARTAASVDLDELNGTTAEAVDAGCDKAATDAAGRYARVSELRAEAAAALEATASSRRILDFGALSAALSAARNAGVAAGAVGAAEEKLKVVTAQRAEAAAASGSALAPPSALDLSALQSAIDDARDAGVARAEIEAAESKAGRSATPRRRRLRVRRRPPPASTPSRRRWTRRRASTRRRWRRQRRSCRARADRTGRTPHSRRRWRRPRRRSTSRPSRRTWGGAGAGVDDAIIEARRQVQQVSTQRWAPRRSRWRRRRRRSLDLEALAAALAAAKEAGVDAAAVAAAEEKLETAAPRGGTRRPRGCGRRRLRARSRRIDDGDRGGARGGRRTEAGLRAHLPFG